MIAQMTGWMDRLNKRERSLVMSLFGVIMVGILVWVVFSVRGSLREKNERIRKNQRSLNEIERLAPQFVAQKQQAKERVERIQNNPHGQSPHIPILKLAQNTPISYRKASYRDTEEQKGTLDNILMPSGDLDMNPIGKRRRKKSKESKLYRVNKSMKMSSFYVRTNDLYPFLAATEGVDDLYFISRLTIKRWTQDPDFVIVEKLVASTLQFVKE